MVDLIETRFAIAFVGDSDLDADSSWDLVLRRAEDQLDGRWVCTELGDGAFQNAGQRDVSFIGKKRYGMLRETVLAVQSSVDEIPCGDIFSDLHRLFDPRKHGVDVDDSVSACDLIQNLYDLLDLIFGRQFFDSDELAGLLAELLFVCGPIGSKTKADDGRNDASNDQKVSDLGRNLGHGNTVWEFHVVFP